MDLAAGTRLGPYEIVALIRRGGMGEVYRARGPNLNRDVALERAATGETNGLLESPYSPYYPELITRGYDLSVRHFAGGQPANR